MYLSLCIAYTYMSLHATAILAKCSNDTKFAGVATAYFHYKAMLDVSSFKFHDRKCNLRPGSRQVEQTSFYISYI